MSVKNLTKSRRKFDDSFKEDIVKMVASGRLVLEVAQALGLSASLIHRWIRKSGSSMSTAAPGTSLQRSQTGPTAELERLKAELRRTETERDILKKLP